jgi:integrase
MGRDGSPPQTTATRVASLISKHIDGTKIGSMRLAAVRPHRCRPGVSDRSQVLSPGTLRLLVALLRSIFAAAVQDRLLPSSPVTRLSMPRSERERIVPLSVAQVQALAQAMPTRSKAMVITQAGLGLRIAELLALPVQDVDLLRRTVRNRVASFSQTGSARFHPKHQDHDGCWRCRTWSPSSATARPECPTRKPGRCGRQRAPLDRSRLPHRGL